MTERIDEHAEGTKPATRPRRVFRRGLRCLQWSVNVLVLVVLVLTFTPAGDWLGGTLIDVDSPAKADYIVVLGGDSERVVEAARLYREGWAEKVVISATGAAVDKYAEVARAYGVPADAVVPDRLPKRTGDHPDTIAKLSGIDRDNTRLIVLTSPYHTSRSRAVFTGAGYRHVTMCSPDWRAGGRFDRLPHSWVTRAASLPTIAYEFAAWGLYWLCGWV